MRAHIIDLALAVVKERGADEPTLDDFIAAGDVAKGTFYNHFRTKNELLFAVGAHVADEIDDRIRPMIADVADPAQRIAIASRMFIRSCKERPEWGWMLLRSVPNLHSGWSEDMRRGVLADIRSGIRTQRFDVPSVQVAVVMGLGALTMAIQTQLIEKTPAGFAEAVAESLVRAMGMSAADAQQIARLPIRLSPST